VFRLLPILPNSGKTTRFPLVTSRLRRRSVHTLLNVVSPRIGTTNRAVTRARQSQTFRSVDAGNRHQTLLGVTGSGKTFSIANVIQELDRPTLVHFAQTKRSPRSFTLSSSQFFRGNAVDISSATRIIISRKLTSRVSDTYIEKDSSINEGNERFAPAATSALLSRRDVIVVASVSCIYGITSPEDYQQMLLTVKRGQHISREAVLVV